MNNWFLISFYKNNFELMNPFVQFYEEVWGIRRFYFLITHTGKDIQPYLDDIQKLNSRKKVHIEYQVIRTDPIIQVNEWGRLKREFFSFLLSKVPDQFQRVLSIDHDEFYYIPNKSVVNSNNELHFHFVEYIPHSKFSTVRDLEWSMQGWYYRVNYFKQASDEDRIEHMQPNELNDFRRDILKIDKRSALGPLTHQWCKLISFERKNMMNPWEHKVGGVICEELDTKKSSEVVEYLHDNYFCYHLGVLDKNYFLEKKTRWLNPKTSKVTMQVGDINGDQGKYFDRFYSKASSFTFVDNYLQKYLQI